MFSFLHLFRFLCSNFNFNSLQKQKSKKNIFHFLKIFLEDILQTNDHISQVFEKYDLIVAQKKPTPNKTAAVLKPQTNTDLLSSLESFPQNNEILLTEVMSNNLNGGVNNTVTHLSELRDIFSELTNTNDCLNNEMELLKPQSINQNSDQSSKDILSFQKVPVAGPSPKIMNKDVRTGYKSFPDLDLLISGVKDSLLSKTEIEVVKETAVVEDESSNDDENMLVGETEVVVVAPIVVEKKIIFKPEIKSLTDIEIDLNKIRPGNEPARTIMDDSDGLKVIFNFAKDIPCPDVSVIVISIINQGREPVSKFQFDASVTKVGFYFLFLN